MNKIIAMYLPQYHEFEENNLWWGKGFTEWTCVKRAKSLCKEHRIKKPHPDIGYYNLLDFEIRKKQALIAKFYGVYGFCYYHYWFGDKVLMDKPLNLMLQDGEPNIPFCFNWANEPWTRMMNGGDGSLLQQNNYGDIKEWDRHLEYLMPFFKNKNYIKIQNKPVFIIYRVSKIPNANDRIKYYDYKLKKEGFEGIFSIFTVGNFFNNDDFESISCFMDASFDLYPNFFDKYNAIKNINNVFFYDIKKAYKIICEDKPIHPNIHFKGIMVGFDRSPRNPLRSNVLVGGNAKMFEDCLNYIISNNKNDFVFINAWNEWGEGCALEPEEKDGYSYLEALKRSIIKNKTKLL